MMATADVYSGFTSGSMTMARNDRALVDQRGYTGAEKNRALTPEEVIWAREAYFRNELNARQIAAKFGLGTDSVRRMLRSETYANIGKALPRAAELDRMGEMEAAESDALLAQLMETQKRVDAQDAAAAAATKLDGPEGDPFGDVPTTPSTPSTPSTPQTSEEAVDLFLNTPTGGKE
jgi:hypothetical protein